METNFTFLQLLLPTLFMLVVGGILTYRITRSLGWTIAIVSIKTGLFLAYWLPARYVYPDDGLEYFTRSEIFNDTSWLAFFSAPDTTWGGGHWGYYLYNWGAKQVFGDLYVSSIALNIALTYVSGLLLYYVCLLLGMSRRLAIFTSAFYLISPDVLTWSTLFNLKDTLVQFLTILYMYFVAQRLRSRPTLPGMVGLAIPIVAVTTVRVYLPVIMAAHFIVLGLWAQRKRFRPSYLLLGGLGAAAIGYFITRLLGVDYPITSTPVRPISDVVFGFGKIVLTPVPLTIAEPYTDTLLLAAWFHWLLMPFAVLGLMIAIERYPRTLMLVVYALGLFLFLTLFTNLLGPRHRFQVSFVFVVFQAIGLYAFLTSWARGYRLQSETVLEGEQHPSPKAYIGLSSSRE